MNPWKFITKLKYITNKYFITFITNIYLNLMNKWINSQCNFIQLSHIDTYLHLCSGRTAQTVVKTKKSNWLCSQYFHRCTAPLWESSVFFSFICFVYSYTSRCLSAWYFNSKCYYFSYCILRQDNILILQSFNMKIQIELINSLISVRSYKCA